MSSGASDSVLDDAAARAEAFKIEANALLSSKDYAGAERLYTQAIELCPQVEAYWTNRALARYGDFAHPHACTFSDAIFAPSIVCNQDLTVHDP
jgi:hypothetical protein